jgi:hypothetical protein
MEPKEIDDEVVVVATLAKDKNKPKVILATSISKMSDMEKLNWILWKHYWDVGYITNKVGGNTRVCIVSETFPTDKGDWVKFGRAFVVSSISTGTETGFRILIFPDAPDTEPRDADGLHFKKTAEANRAGITAMYKSITGKYTTVSFWKAGVGKEYRGFIDTKEPSAKTYRFSPSPVDCKYSPIEGTEALLDENMDKMFGLLATSREHPAYLEFEEQV